MFSEILYQASTWKPIVCIDGLLLWFLWSHDKGDDGFVVDFEVRLLLAEFCCAAWVHCVPLVEQNVVLESIKACPTEQLVPPLVRFVLVYWLKDPAFGLL